MSTSHKTTESTGLLECSQRALKLNVADRSMFVLLVELHLSSVHVWACQHPSYVIAFA